ncbi:MAG: hypothetical protein Fur0032_19000 [Terrimicrobiaceae bacterium]
MIRAALPFLLSVVCLLAVPSLLAAPGTPSPDDRIPESLRAWEGWALWNDKDLACPSPYSDGKGRICAWPSALTIEAGPSGAKFSQVVEAYCETWVPLPGSKEAWPLDVSISGKPVVVLERDGQPAVKIPAGRQLLEGRFTWAALPQRLLLPREIGIVSLNLDGRPVELPAWDADGWLWLRRDAVNPDEPTRDFLSKKVYAVLEDGIPLWLRTRVELIVSGKSREEDLGNVLPEGWKVASVGSALPVAIDDSGRLRAQVRPGRWTVEISAFRLDDARELTFASGTQPAVSEILVGLRSQPNFRTIEVVGAPAVDVSQTTFPGDWRDMPVYLWETAAPLRWEERMRGMGLRRPEGLRFSREWWLDEDGQGMTFRDRVRGTMQEIWRLDAAHGLELGSVRNRGEGQLVTINPINGAPGVEIRTRDIEVEATGRMPAAGLLSATGWRSDAASVGVDWNLPPGWRLFALFGADWVRGDWLTAWTLLDLFVVLLMALALLRVLGWKAAVLAFVALVLSYHEVGAPRLVWLAMVVPVALLGVVPDGWPRRIVNLWKWGTAVILVLILVPFLSKQVQQAIFPQLEVLPRGPVPMAVSGLNADQEMMVSEEPVPLPSAAAPRADKSQYFSAPVLSSSLKQQASKNLLYDASARIQTGPGVPQWSWRRVSFGWNGPVDAGQTVQAILIPLPLERVLTILRIVLLVWLAAVLLRGAGRAVGRRAGGPVAALALLLFMNPGAAMAQFPPPEMLETLRSRLTERSDAFPEAAQIPSATLTIDGNHLLISADIHAGTEVAVPVPGRVPTWSPVSVRLNGQPAPAVRRNDGFLWVVVPEGVSRIEVEGLLPQGVGEWEWAFQLTPRTVKVVAPGWAVSGVNRDGVPEAQVLLSREARTETAEASYDRQDFAVVASVEREIEMGLVWQVRTKVRRLSPPGRAISLRIPLLPGENVLSAQTAVDGNFVEIRLGASDTEAGWQSELAIVDEITLSTSPQDTWVERWHLVVSPVWNVAFSGLAPVFSPDNPDLVPVWQPWPGERVQLYLSRPQAVAGATLTINSVTHQVALGQRQRSSDLNLVLTCSVGQDFLVGLPPRAEVTSLSIDDRQIPVRISDGKLIVPIRPGEPRLRMQWNDLDELGFRVASPAVLLPTESANISTVLDVPGDRWVFWASGPLRGPAVRFWVVLACSLIAAAVLASMRLSPLSLPEWMLLGIGLTQVPLPAALFVVGWLFFLSWRGTNHFRSLPAWGFNVFQVALVGVTALALGILVAVVGEGLLGSPEMFITGNESTRTMLRWFAARSPGPLPEPVFYSVSIWWYRFLMLAWALWLAASLIRWLRWGWGQFLSGGFFRKKQPTPPPVPGK